MGRGADFFLASWTIAPLWPMHSKADQEAGGSWLMCTLIPDREQKGLLESLHSPQHVWGACCEPRLNCQGPSLISAQMPPGWEALGRSLCERPDPKGWQRLLFAGGILMEDWVVFPSWGALWKEFLKSLRMLRLERKHGGKTRVGSQLLWMLPGCREGE